MAEPFSLSLAPTPPWEAPRDRRSKVQAVWSEGLEGRGGKQERDGSKKNRRLFHSFKDFPHRILFTPSRHQHPSKDPWGTRLRLTTRCEGSENLGCVLLTVAPRLSHSTASLPIFTYPHPEWAGYEAPVWAAWMLDTKEEARLKGRQAG